MGVLCILRVSPNLVWWGMFVSLCLFGRGLCSQCLCWCPIVRLALGRLRLLNWGGMVWNPSECVCPNLDVEFLEDPGRCGVIVCLFLPDILWVVWMECSLLNAWCLFHWDVFGRTWLYHLWRVVVVEVDLVLVCLGSISTEVCVDLLCVTVILWIYRTAVFLLNWLYVGGVESVSWLHRFDPVVWLFHVWGRVTSGLFLSIGKLRWKE